MPNLAKKLRKILCRIKKLEKYVYNLTLTGGGGSSFLTKTVSFTLSSNTNTFQIPILPGETLNSVLLVMGNGTGQVLGAGDFGYSIVGNTVTTTETWVATDNILIIYQVQNS